MAKEVTQDFPFPPRLSDVVWFFSSSLHVLVLSSMHLPTKAVRSIYEATKGLRRDLGELTKKTGSYHHANCRRNLLGTDGA